MADDLVEPDATVHRLDYRILDREGGLVQRFRFWTELPPGQASEGSVPVFPVAFEFKAKSFLRLHAVRVTDTASNSPRPTAEYSPVVRKRYLSN